MRSEGISTAVYPRRIALVLRLEALVSECCKMWPKIYFLSELEHPLKSLSQVDRNLVMLNSLLCPVNTIAPIKFGLMLGI